MKKLQCIGLQPSRNNPLHGRVFGMARKLVIELPDGSRQMLEQVLAEHELQLQEKLSCTPSCCPCTILAW